MIINRRYETAETLGRGGMGVVFRARDLLTGSLVAIKKVTVPMTQERRGTQEERPDEALALAQEFRALATMRHPHIISVFDFGFDEDHQPYFTMEYLAGGQSILEFGQERTPEEQLDLFIQMFQALDYLHRRGVLHRDLKPSNALVADGRLKLLDFGLSVLTSHTMEHRTQTTAGTMAYMAPELFQGEPYSQASDIYAAGLIAFELFTGAYPYSENNIAAMIHDVVSMEVDAASFGLAEGLVPVFNRLLAKSREKRYGSTSEVINDLCEAAGIPLPPESRQIRESYLQAARFVGREKEMARLQELLREAAAGRGATIFIGGESGVGKSRLLEEIRTHALVDGFLVLRGQTVSRGRSPYQLWKGVLRTALLYSELEEGEEAIFRSAVPDLERLIDRSVQPLPPLITPATRGGLARATRRLLRGTALPVMVILEDLQWAGSESLQLLKDLSTMVQGERILIAGSYREDEPADIQSEIDTAQHLHLRRLSGEEISLLSESMLGQAGTDPEVVDILMRETEGNALFLVEIVRALAEEAGQLDRIRPSTIPANIPAGGIKEIIDRHLQRVPTDAFPLLQLASVAGRVLDLPLLRVLEPGIQLENWLTVCTDISVLDAYGETWRFSHDKIREEIRERLPDDLHHHLHRRVAEALEMVHPDDDEQAAGLAHHWAVAGDPEKVLYYSEKAGRLAAANNANEEAIRFLGKALELLRNRPRSDENERRELSLLMALGPCLMANEGFNASEVRRLYGEASRLAVKSGQVEALFQATWGQWEYYVHSDLEVEAAGDLLSQLLDMAEQSGDPNHLLEAHHAGWATSFARGDPSAMADHGRRGLEIYKSGNFIDHHQTYGHDPGVCAYANLGVSLWLIGYPEQSLESVRLSAQLAEEIKHPFSSAISLWGESINALLRGDFEPAVTRSTELAKLSRENGFPNFSKIAGIFQGIAYSEYPKDDKHQEIIQSVYDQAVGDREFFLWPWILSKYLYSCGTLGFLSKGIEAVEKEVQDHRLMGERLFESEVRREYGRLMLADQSHSEEGEKQIQLALEIARKQNAKALELRAVMSLADFWHKQGKSKQAYNQLNIIYSSFTEGWDSADLIRAKRLLDEIREDL